MKTGYKIEILKKLLSGMTLKSNDVYASNSNQYFKSIKDQGVSLDEVWTPNIYNDGKHKERSLTMDEDNISRAASLLRWLQG